MKNVTKRNELKNLGEQQFQKQRVLEVELKQLDNGDKICEQKSLGESLDP